MDDIPLPGDLPVSDDQSFTALSESQPDAEEDPPPQELANEAIAELIQNNTNPEPPEPEENVTPQVLEIPQNGLKSTETNLAETNKPKEEIDNVSKQQNITENRPDVPVPGESEQEFYSTADVPAAAESVVAPPENRAPVPTPLMATEVYVGQPVENDPKISQPAVLDAAMQNSQVQYSAAANYMAYPTQMSDPSLMHNYSYMTASSYNDYMSMYHAGRMSRSYPNAYAPYQNYNYSYPHMQQMYDGRSMGYPSASYPTQMLPPTPPLPRGHQMAHATAKNFTPPLPSDYSAPSFSSEPPRAKKPQSRVNDKEINSNILSESDMPPLPDEAMPEQPKETPSEDEQGHDESFTASQPDDADTAEEDPDKMLTDSAGENFSEDVNRYSPSLPMDEDEANQQSGNAEDGGGGRIKTSSVLGKAQAKKRLMAFSISKQAAAAQIAAKKAQSDSSSNRGRKENGDGSATRSDDHVTGETVMNSGNVFDDKHAKKKTKKSSKMERARETIEEIEEIKRAEMSTLMYRQNLLNDSSVSENASDRRARDSEDRKEKSSRRRSRSYSRSRSRRRSRSRSRDRKSRRGARKHLRRSRSKSKSRSKSRSRSRSDSHQLDKKPKVKTTDVKSWADFAEAGFQLDRYRRIKFKENKNFLISEVERRKKEESKNRSRRSHSRERKSISIEKEVIEESRNKRINFFDIPMELKQPVVCVKDKGNVEEVMEYPSHIVQYTNARPVVKYCENLKHARLHFVTRAQLLETVPDDVAVIMKRFFSSIRSKRLKTRLQSDENQGPPPYSSNSHNYVQKWWLKDALQDGLLDYEEDDVEDDDQEATQITSFDDVNGDHHDPDKSVTKLPEKSGVRKSRFENATEETTGVSVVVRSRWDSDYEDSPKQTLESKIPENDTLYPKSPPRTENHVSKSNCDTASVKDGSRREYEDVIEDNVASKRSEETHSRKHKDKSKHDDRHKHHEKKSKKPRLESPEQWCTELEVESDTRSKKQNVEETYFEEPPKATESTESNKGDQKLVSEYEEFLKMVSFEQPKVDTGVQLYEGPRPPPPPPPQPPLVKERSVEPATSQRSKAPSESRNPSGSSDEDKSKMDVDEEEFDVDKFFLKEKEKKMKKLGLLNANENESATKKDTEEENSEAEPKHKKKRDKKRKKKKLSVKVKKLDAKNKKKRKRKKKYNSSSTSSDSSDNSDSDDTSDNSESSDSSSSSTSSSSSSDDSSTDSTSRKKRKRSKKTKKRDKKKERKVGGDKSKRKKKKQKTHESDSEDKKKKRKSKSDDAKRKKAKKLPPENFLELIEKSLAVSLKKPESDESAIVKKLVKEKRKKRKKKNDKEKKPKEKSLLDLLPEECSKQLAASLEEDRLTAETKSSDRPSPVESKKKKKKSKKKKASSDSEDEVPSWKKKIVDPKEIEESVAKAQMNPFFEDALDDWDKSDADSSAVEYSMRDVSKNVNDEEESEKTKKKPKDSKHREVKKLKYKKSPKRKKISKKDRDEVSVEMEKSPLDDPGIDEVRCSSPNENFDMFASHSHTPSPVKVYSPAKHELKNRFIDDHDKYSPVEPYSKNRFIDYPEEHSVTKRDSRDKFVDERDERSPDECRAKDRFFDELNVYSPVKHTSKDAFVDERDKYSPVKRRSKNSFDDREKYSPGKRDSRNRFVDDNEERSPMKYRSRNRSNDRDEYSPVKRESRNRYIDDREKYSPTELDSRTKSADGEKYSPTERDSRTKSADGREKYSPTRRDSSGKSVDDREESGKARSKTKFANDQQHSPKEQHPRSRFNDEPELPSQVNHRSKNKFVDDREPSPVKCRSTSRFDSDRETHSPIKHRSKKNKFVDDREPSPIKHRLKNNFVDDREPSPAKRRRKSRFTSDERSPVSSRYDISKYPESGPKIRSPDPPAMNEEPHHEPEVAKTNASKPATLSDDIFAESPQNDDSFSKNYNSASVFPCFTLPTVQNMGFASTSPTPVPAPVPPPVISPFAVEKIALPKTPPEIDHAEVSSKSGDSVEEPKSFSFGKLEVKTKAAKKFVHSNIFESFDHGGAEMPVKCASEAGDEVAETVNKSDIPEEDDKEEFQARPCIELRDIPIQARVPFPGGQNEAEEVKSDAKSAAESRREPTPDRRSHSRDRGKSRNYRDRDDSRDRYRRRSSSRDRYRKSYRGRYSRNRYRGRRSSRSRSRSRRRSRDRESRDPRRRHNRRRSYSRENSCERNVKRRTPEPDENRASLEKMTNNKTEDEEKRMDERYDRRSYDHYNRGFVRKPRTPPMEPCTNESNTNGEAKKEITTLQENLYQLKETLKNLNKQGVHLDALNSALASLENNEASFKGSDDMKMHSNSIAEITRRYRSPTDDQQAKNTDFQNIVSLCNAIQGGMPIPSNDQGLANAADSVQTKKSVADSTNGGFAKNRFEDRSREISPKPLSLDERLELELGVKRSNANPAIPAQSAPLMAASPYYPMPGYQCMPNFAAPPPMMHGYPPMMNSGPPNRGYYASLQASMAWNNQRAFMGQDMTKMRPPVMLPPHHGLPPPHQRAMPQPNEPNSMYRQPETAASKVHSIQVGNVLQIVPTEVQPTSGSSQLKTLPQVSVSSASAVTPSTSQVTNASANTTTTVVSGFSSLLSAHLPVSFAAAPAVSGSKANAQAAKTNESPSKEQKLTPTKPKELFAPLLAVTSSSANVAANKLANLPLPPGTPETEMKKLIRLAKEKRKEEKVLQHLLKVKGMHGSPHTPNSDDGSLAEEAEGNEEPLTPISIKPSPEQGILISPGFKEKSTPVTALGRSIIGSSRKMVSFVDGIRPGAATVTDSPPTKVRKASPPPAKKKHKVRVKIIRPDDSDDDDTPPPPPPGPPPPELYPPTLASLARLQPGFLLPKI